jgi:UDP:flavonoid glycosyltransferase YjiC (YdhE family)
MTSHGLAAVFRGRLEGRGLTPPVARWHIDPCPPLLQIDGWSVPGNHLAIRPEAYGGPGRRSPMPTGSRGRTRPRVLVTFGTLFSSPRVLNPLLRELARQDMEIVATTGLLARREDFDVEPDKVTLVEFTPLAELLQNVDAVVTHGGAGSVFGTLAAGIPMVVIPQGAGQHLQADRVAAAGAGIALLDGHDEPARVAEATAAVLNQPAYARAARTVARQIATLPSAQDVATRLAAELH